ncbi:RNA binding protein [Pseudozyma hubeiensis SY62]|uniref:RNA binding protein n=1 Tax=Pseudozyma hubeiensis (strain SY62) TaxID=1305764 RepID=R9P5R3_PSEHS|nr:RNA binding protein [Pseudozyma hubeiensis SY62]GAC93430.1 RNA binding protein [Pseudozyma hubeiensis SY62]
MRASNGHAHPQFAVQHCTSVRAIGRRRAVPIGAAFENSRQTVDTDCKSIQLYMECMKAVPTHFFLILFSHQNAHSNGFLRPAVELQQARTASSVYCAADIDIVEGHVLANIASRLESFPVYFELRSDAYLAFDIFAGHTRQVPPRLGYTRRNDDEAHHGPGSVGWCRVRNIFSFQADQLRCYATSASHTLILDLYLSLLRSERAAFRNRSCQRRRDWTFREGRPQNIHGIRGRVKTESTAFGRRELMDWIFTKVGRRPTQADRRVRDGS